MRSKIYHKSHKKTLLGPKRVGDPPRTSKSGPTRGGTPLKTHPEFITNLGKKLIENNEKLSVESRRARTAARAEFRKEDPT